jgi:hypothetical protein
MINLLFGMSLAGFFYQTIQEAKALEKQNRFLLILGDDRDVEKLKKANLPYKVGIQGFNLWNSIYGVAHEEQFVPNPTYMQNYRKYFD